MRYFNPSQALHVAETAIRLTDYWLAQAGPDLACFNFRSCVGVGSLGPPFDLCIVQAAFV